MTHERLFDMPLLPHLIIDGLNRYDDRPFLFLGDATITYAEVRAHASRFAQAYEAKGIAKGSRTAVLSANRPEVLYNLCANMVVGSCNTPLHPLGSAEDQAYVLQDAEIETLVYDPTVFAPRAAELKERVPGLKHLLAFGPTSIRSHWSLRTLGPTTSTPSSTPAAPRAAPRVFASPIDPRRT
jgi:fatty-acyl-CoA synthase